MEESAPGGWLPIWGIMTAVERPLFTTSPLSVRLANEVLCIIAFEGPSWITLIDEAGRLCVEAYWAPGIYS